MIHLLTGPVHSGKTTLLREAISRLRSQGIRLKGVVSETLWQGGEIQGYDLLDLESGVGLPFLRRLGEAGWEATGAFFMNPKNCRAAETILLAPSPAQLLVVDEVGPLEMKGRGLWPALARVLEAPPQACLIVVREKILQSCKERLGAHPFTVYDVREDQVLERLVQEITDHLKRDARE